MALRASSSSNSAARAGPAALSAISTPISAVLAADTGAKGKERWNRSMLMSPDHLSRSSARRFLAHASSLWPVSVGRSLPKLTASTWPEDTPSSVSDLATASARFWPRARLYSRPPRSSAWPSRLELQRLLVVQALGAVLDQAAVLVLDDEAVVVEEHDALALDARRPAGRPGRRSRPCVARWRSGRPADRSAASRPSGSCSSSSGLVHAARSSCEADWAAAPPGQASVFRVCGHTLLEVKRAGLQVPGRRWRWTAPPVKPRGTVLVNHRLTHP